MPENTSIWGRVDYLAPRLSSSTRISVTAFGEAVSILFDDALVDLDAKADGLEGWWSTGLVLAVQPGGRREFGCQLRGFIAKTSASQAVLTVSAGGQSTTRDFKYGTESQGEDLHISLNFDVSPLTGGRVVIFVALHAERQNFDENVKIALDSVDLAEALKTTPA